MVVEKYIGEKDGLEILQNSAFTTSESTTNYLFTNDNQTFHTTIDIYKQDKRRCIE